MKVKDVMTTQVITVKEDQTKQQVARLLTRHLTARDHDYHPATE